MKYDKSKIKIKLKNLFNREPTENEIINADKDSNIICEVLFDEIEDLKKRITKLGG